MVIPVCLSRSYLGFRLGICAKKWDPIRSPSSTLRQSNMAMEIPSMGIKHGESISKWAHVHCHVWLPERIRSISKYPIGLQCLRMNYDTSSQQRHDLNECKWWLGRRKLTQHLNHSKHSKLSPSQLCFNDVSFVWNGQFKSECHEYSVYI